MERKPAKSGQIRTFVGGESINKNSPPRTQYIQDRQPKQETQVKFEVIS